MASAKQWTPPDLAHRAQEIAGALSAYGRQVLEAPEPVENSVINENFLMAGCPEQLDACFLRNDAALSRYDGNHVRPIRLGPNVDLDGFFGELDRFDA